MWTAIYRLVVLIAVIVVGSWHGIMLLRQFNNFPFGYGEARGVLFRDSADQFETTSPNTVDAYVERDFDPESRQVKSETRYFVTPIIIQDSGKALPPMSRRPIVMRWSRIGLFGNQSPGRQCPSHYSSDLVVFRNEVGSTAVFADDAKAISNYMVVHPDQKEAGYILVEYADSDTDGDGKLTCNDFLSLAHYDIDARELTEIDLGGGEPVWNHETRFNLPPVIGVGVDENGDGRHDVTRETVRVAMFDAATKSLTYLTPE